MSDPVLKAAKANRDRLHGELNTIVAKAEAGNRSLTAQEDLAFSRLSTQIKELDARIADRKAEGKRHTQSMRNAIADPGGTGISPLDGIRGEPMTYDQRGNNSYLLDLATVAIEARGGGGPGDGAGAARERLGQHLKEMSIEARNKRVSRTLYASGFLRPGQEIRTNPNTTAGTGGEFVPPLWLVSQYVPYARPGRTFANRCVNYPLPPGVDVINIPRITVGSQAAIQTANAAAVSSVDIVTSTVAANVNTIAGQEDISLQLLEQSPIAMDGVVFQDLAADYDQRLDLQVVAGTGTNGQHLGVLSVSSATSNTSNLLANGVNCTSTTFYDGSTASSQYRSIVSGITSIETLRFASPTAIWVHPRRSNSWMFHADSTTAGSGRPLFSAARYGTFNDVGVMSVNPVPQGVAGELAGLPVVKDANMSTTNNGTATTGGTQDAIVVLKEDDLSLWEGQLKMRALPEVLSGTLQIRFQVYAYSALQVARFPQSLSLVTGAGLAAPTY